MYSVSRSFTDAAKANNRQILVKAVFGNTIELTGDNIIDMTITEATNASDGLSMGATISSKIVMTIKMPETPLMLEGNFVQPSVGFVGAEDYCPLGKFYITEAVSKDDFKTQFTITGYDGFSKTEMPYTPTISMPNTERAILLDILSQCGLEISDSIAFAGETGSAVVDDSGVLIYQELPTFDGDTGTIIGSSTLELMGDGTLVDVTGGTQLELYDYTCREYIGFISGLSGKNARFDRDGKLTFVWYSDHGFSIMRDAQYMGGLKRLTSGDAGMASITSGTSDNVIVSGTGVGISFENPFMTQERLDNIFAEVGMLTYTPATLKWRGNPAIEAGDIVVAEDSDGISRSLLVMEQTLKIGGGMHSEIKCYGESEAEIAFQTSPQRKRLEQVYTKLQEAIAEATKLLNGSNGGIFELLDENGDGVNEGWIIHTADGQKHIKANVNGIGITTDGGRTYEQALTTNGLNASAIRTGTMSAERITVGDAELGDVFSVELDEQNHPVVTIGASNSDIKQKQTNDAIIFSDSADETVAKFSTTGAEWTDMQQMKYCGFLWTKSSLTGNVRFTKVGAENGDTNE